MLAQSVGIGIVISLLLTETLGIAAGGIVVPGYIAYELHHPWKVAVTFLVGWVVLLLVRFLSNFALIYGRRLLVISILLGYLLGYLARLFPPIPLDGRVLDLAAIGYVIPGLLAYWMERQGVYRTITTALVAAALTRLILAAFTGGRILP